jgi:hypothetical protein
MPAGAREPPLGRVARGACSALALAALTCLASASAARSAPPEGSSRAYDTPGVIHGEQCIGTPGGGAVPVRDIDGEQLQGAAGSLTDPPEARETCADGAGLRVEGIEAVAAAGMTMYYTWPLEHGAQAPGFVSAGGLASAPSVNAADGAGNGRVAPVAAGEPAYEITPVDIAPEQRYSGPGTARWYTYSVYGRPVGGARFALMSWSWIDVAGGGIARAAVSEGELFHPAAVQPITLDSAAGERQPANGSVTARYGSVSNGSEELYGWMVTSHTSGGVCYDHMAYAGGGEPLGGTLCPEGALSDSVWNASIWNRGGP